MTPLARQRAIEVIDGISYSVERTCIHRIDPVGRAHMADGVLHGKRQPFEGVRS